MSLKIVFMGTPDFALPTLQKLQKTGHKIVGVYSQPPRPKGRGHRLHPSPVQSWAMEHGLPTYTPSSLKPQEIQQQLAALQPDVIIVVAYGLLLPQAVLDIPRFGCINVHASLLPRWRGAAPIQRAIQAGDTITGVSIMRMDAGLDTGPVCATVTTPITSTMTAYDLAQKLAEMGAQCLVDTLPDYIDGTCTPQPQPETGATYAAKLTRQERFLQWTQSATMLEQHIRALTPWPGSFFMHDGHAIKVHAAQVHHQVHKHPPGTVLDTQLSIACASGILQPTILQKPGGKPLPISDFLNGFSIPIGTVLPCSDSA